MGGLIADGKLLYSSVQITIHMDKDSILKKLEALSESTDKILVNEAALSEVYVPDAIIARDNQMTELLHTAKYVFSSGIHYPTVLVLGPSGSGKTVTVKYIAKAALTFAAEKNRDVRYVYVNCRAMSETKVLLSALEQLGAPENLLRWLRGSSKRDYYEAFMREIEKENSPVILVFDEIESIRDPNDFLYFFSRELPSVTRVLICISNMMDFETTLDMKVRNSFLPRHIYFDQYTADELEKILAHRAQLALTPGSVEEGVLQFLATIAAREGGNARYAIKLLREAANLAILRGGDKVTLQDAREAVRSVEVRETVEALRTLQLHSQLLIAAISALEVANRSIEKPVKIGTGHIYLLYRKAAGICGLSSLSTRRLVDLIDDLEMRGLISTRIISHGRYGKRRYVSIEFDPNLVLEVSDELREIREKLMEPAVNLLRDEINS